jgi:hypothetical protein
MGLEEEEKQLFFQESRVLLLSNKDYERTAPATS